MWCLDHVCIYIIQGILSINEVSDLLKNAFDCGCLYLGNTLLFAIRWNKFDERL